MKKTMLAVLFSAFMLAAMGAPSLSQESVPGVAAGDYFVYEGFFVHNTTNSFLPIAEQLLPYMFWNETDYVTYTVIGVTGTNITFEAVLEYSNGTEVTETVVEDVTNPVNYLCIGAGLESGDVFIADDGYGSGTLQINETINVDYGMEIRETNYHASTTSVEAVIMRQYWFDLQCGFLARQVLTAEYTEGTDNSTTEFTLMLMETNVIPEFSVGTVMLLVFVAVTVCVDIYRRKRLKC
jgi:uncharacterized protein YheU (UPF0270 family)